MATLAGYVNRYGARAAARLLSQAGPNVSDSTVRTALGGNRRKDRAISDETRERLYYSLNERMEAATGKTVPSQLRKDLQKPPKPEPGRKVQEYKSHDAIVIGAETSARRITPDELNKLLSEANRRFYGKRWVVSVYGIRAQATGQRPGDSDPVSGFKKGWFAKPVDPGSGTVHPVMQAAQEAREGIDQALANTPRGLTPAVDKAERAAIRKSYVPLWAEMINGQEWGVIYAVWIGPAKQY